MHFKAFSPDNSHSKSFESLFNLIPLFSVIQPKIKREMESFEENLKFQEKLKMEKIFLNQTYKLCQYYSLVVF